MKRILAYSAFMSFTMGFVHVPITRNPLLTYMIGFVWSLIWLGLYVKKGKWEWFVSSVLTWQTIGLLYGLLGYNLIQLVDGVGIVVGSAFGINAFISLFTSHPFTTLFTRNIHFSSEGPSLRLHRKVTVFWLLVIVVNALSSYWLEYSLHIHSAWYSMTIVLISVISVKRFFKSKIAYSRKLGTEKG